MNLFLLKSGESGKITKIGAIGPLKRRLMDMGVLVRANVKVGKGAPLGGLERTIFRTAPSGRRRGIAPGAVRAHVLWEKDSRRTIVDKDRHFYTLLEPTSHFKQLDNTEGNDKLFDMAVNVLLIAIGIHREGGIS